MRKLAEWLYMKNSHNLRRVWPNILHLVPRLKAISSIVELTTFLSCNRFLVEISALGGHASISHRNKGEGTLLRFIRMHKHDTWCNKAFRVDSVLMGVFIVIDGGSGGAVVFAGGSDRHAVPNKVALDCARPRAADHDRRRDAPGT